MLYRVGRFLLAGAILLGPAAGLARDDACQKVLASRIRACTETCIDKAKAAVAPEIRDRITGRGCAKNCTKLEIFNEHGCP